MFKAIFETHRDMLMEEEQKLKTKTKIIYPLFWVFFITRLVTSIICLVMMKDFKKNKNHKIMTIVDVILYVICASLLFTLLYYTYYFNLLSLLFICIVLMLYISSKIVMLIKYDAINRHWILLYHLPDIILLTSFFLIILAIVLSTSDFFFDME